MMASDIDIDDVSTDGDDVSPNEAKMQLDRELIERVAHGGGAVADAETFIPVPEGPNYRKYREENSPEEEEEEEEEGDEDEAEGDEEEEEDGEEEDLLALDDEVGEDGE